VTSFEQMTDDAGLARTLREVYGHPDKVDLMVGLYAEKPPEGFGFCTRPGMDWIENNTMITVLLRHFPELTPALRRASNAFAPWT
jgi:hypothetical protein